MSPISISRIALPVSSPTLLAVPLVTFLEGELKFSDDAVESVRDGIIECEGDEDIIRWVYSGRVWVVGDEKVRSVSVWVIGVEEVRDVWSVSDEEVRGVGDIVSGCVWSVVDNVPERVRA